MVSCSSVCSTNTKIISTHCESPFSYSSAAAHLNWQRLNNNWTLEIWMVLELCTLSGYTSDLARVGRQQEIDSLRGSIDYCMVETLNNFWNSNPDSEQRILNQLCTIVSNGCISDNPLIPQGFKTVNAVSIWLKTSVDMYIKSERNVTVGRRYITSGQGHSCNHNP